MGRTGRNQRETGGKGEWIRDRQPLRAHAGGSHNAFTFTPPPPAGGPVAQPGAALRTAVIGPGVTPRAVTKEHGSEGAGRSQGCRGGRGWGPWRPRLRDWCGVGGGGTEPARGAAWGWGWLRLPAAPPALSCPRAEGRGVLCRGSAGRQSCRRPAREISVRRCIRCHRALS